MGIVLVKMIWAFDLITNYADDSNCADTESLGFREESDTMRHCDENTSFVPRQVKTFSNG